jgi:hypothetical protein
LTTVNTPGSEGQNPPLKNPIGNFDQPILAIVDPQAFNVVRTAIADAFSASRVESFLRSLKRQGLRIRDFEAILGKDLLGGSAKAQYFTLGNGDQGQIREFYLASLERVAADLRARFFKLYAYY